MRYLRWIAKAVTFAYLSLAIAQLAVSASEENGEVLSTVVVLVAPILAASLYWWGLVRPAGARGRALRAFGWFAMLAGSVALISFSFVVWPLLLLAAPYSFLRDDEGEDDVKKGRMAGVID